jgi:putative DNA primase/helicase
VKEELPDFEAIRAKGLQVEQARRRELELRAVVPSPKACNPRPFMLSESYDLVEFLRADIPPMQYLIEPFLPEAGLALLFGPPGSLKSFVAHRLALDIARGQPFLSYNVPRRRPVLYIDGELPTALIHQRLTMIHNGEAPPDPGWFRILSSEDLLQRRGYVLDFNNPDHSQCLLDEVSQAITMPPEGCLAPGLIILDCLAALLSAWEENSNEAAARLNHWLNQLRFMGLAVLLVHHSGKSGVEGGPRGASALTGAMDCVISLEPKGESDQPRCNLRFTKQRHKHVAQKQIEIELAPTKYGLELKVLGPRCDPLIETLLAIHQTEPESGRKLAPQLGLSPSTTNERLKVLRQRGWLFDMTITPKGKKVAGILD